MSFDRSSVNPPDYVDTYTPSLLHSIDRGGGLDINPFRSTIDDSAPEMRLSRQ